MNEADRVFAPSYALARANFLRAAQGLQLSSYLEPAQGREAEALSVDVARDGPADAAALLIISSGCHGVEGHCGSGIQVALLDGGALHEQARAAGVALLYIHALNPWGFSFGRRVTREGVDLNRNFVDFSLPRPRNPGYEQLAAHLLPDAWPPAAADEDAITAYANTHGMGALQQAVTGGQYEYPDGLFYGGAEPTWCQATLRQILGREARRCQRLGWLDLHTGLGEAGKGERIFAARDDDATRMRAKAWWGPHVSFTEDGNAASSRLHGNLWEAAYQECPQAAYTGIALEFGTRPLPEVLAALRFDHWVARQAHPHPELVATARARMQEAFFTDTPAWRAAVLRQGLEAALLAVRGMR